MKRVTDIELRDALYHQKKHTLVYRLAADLRDILVELGRLDADGHAPNSQTKRDLNRSFEDKMRDL